MMASLSGAVDSQMIEKSPLELNAKVCLANSSNHWTIWECRSCSRVLSIVLPTFILFATFYFLGIPIMWRTLKILFTTPGLGLLVCSKRRSHMGSKPDHQWVRPSGQMAFMIDVLGSAQSHAVHGQARKSAQWGMLVTEPQPKFACVIKTRTPRSRTGTHFYWQRRSQQCAPLRMQNLSSCKLRTFKPE